MADASVRAARATDAPAMAAVQARAWSGGGDPAASGGAEAAPVLPDLDERAAAAAWRDAVADPPSPGHRVAVALEGERLVGFLAWEPSDDPDATPGETRIAALVVDPASRGRGHGSRLLSAWADLARESGATGGSAWLPADDTAQRAFLESAGWAPDGAFRTLESDGGGTLTVVRLVTSLE